MQTLLRLNLITQVNKIRMVKRKRTRGLMKKLSKRHTIMETEHVLIECSDNGSFEWSSDDSDEEEVGPQQQEDIIANRKFFFRVNDVRRVRWDLFIMLLATWN